MPLRITRIVAWVPVSPKLDVGAVNEVEAVAAICVQLENFVVMPGWPPARWRVTVSVTNFGFATAASISTSSSAVPTLATSSSAVPSGVCPSPEPLMSQASLENSSTV